MRNLEHVARDIISGQQKINDRMAKKAAEDAANLDLQMQIRSKIIDETPADWGTIDEHQGYFHLSAHDENAGPLLVSNTSNKNETANRVKTLLAHPKAEHVHTIQGHNTKTGEVLSFKKHHLQAHPNAFDKIHEEDLNEAKKEEEKKKKNELKSDSNQQLSDKSGDGDKGKGDDEDSPDEKVKLGGKTEVDLDPKIDTNLQKDADTKGSKHKDSGKKKPVHTEEKVPSDHWRGDQKDYKSELERHHIDYMHDLWMKENGKKKKKIKTEGLEEVEAAKAFSAYHSLKRKYKKNAKESIKSRVKLGKISKEQGDKHLEAAQKIREDFDQPSNKEPTQAGQFSPQPFPDKDYHSDKDRADWHMDKGMQADQKGDKEAASNHFKLSSHFNKRHFGSSLDVKPSAYVPMAVSTEEVVQELTDLERKETEVLGAASHTTKCSHCHGTGKVHAGKDHKEVRTCKKCSGRGSVVEEVVNEFSPEPWNPKMVPPRKPERPISKKKIAGWVAAQRQSHQDLYTRKKPVSEGWMKHGERTFTATAGEKHKESCPRCKSKLDYSNFASHTDDKGKVTHWKGRCSHPGCNTRLTVFNEENVVMREAKAGRPSLDPTHNEPIIMQMKKAKTLGSYRVKHADGSYRVVKRDEANRVLNDYSSKKTTSDKEEHAKKVAKHVVTKNGISLGGSARVGGTKENWRNYRNRSLGL